jgi:DNA invertase Pin-like site-specific DNA recombinase
MGKPASAAPRAALYLRVSTRQQHLVEQLRQLRRLSEARGFEIVRVYRERRSAFKERPAHRQLMADAAMRRFDVVVVWSMDRFARSLVELLACVDRLDERKVRFVSLREPAVDTTSAAGKLILSVLGAAAEFERNRLRERTRMGLDAARRRGSVLGRPLSSKWNESRAQIWHAAGTSSAEIARRLGVSERTARRRLAREGVAA